MSTPANTYESLLLSLEVVRAHVAKVRDECDALADAARDRYGKAGSHVVRERLRDLVRALDAVVVTANPYSVRESGAVAAVEAAIFEAEATQDRQARRAQLQVVAG